MAGKAGFEIIHTDYPLVHFFEEFSKVPIVYTLHDRLPHENTLDYWILSKFRQHKFIAISQSQKKGLLPLNFVGTVFHGINLEDYPFSLDSSGNYMAFIGRLIRDKGAHNAVKVADELKFDLHIATEPVYKKNIYFKKEIEPYVDGERVNVLGYITGREKMEFYQNARLLLFPIEWEEPFGLVMIEAMACGTPVVAFARGSVQEVIKDGVTGFVIEAENGKNGKGRTLKGSVPKTQIKKRGVEGLIEAVEKIYSMPEDEYKKMRLACRKHVEENFTTEKMAEGYETIYRKVLSHK
jgi:glycosyltransferase involved in cell wall biosynthesis